MLIFHILQSYTIIVRNDSFRWLFLIFVTLFEINNKNTIQMTLLFYLLFKVITLIFRTVQQLQDPCYFVLNRLKKPTLLKIFFCSRFTKQSATFPVNHSFRRIKVRLFWLSCSKTIGAIVLTFKSPSWVSSFKSTVIGWLTWVPIPIGV